MSTHNVYNKDYMKKYITKIHKCLVFKEKYGGKAKFNINMIKKEKN